MYPPGKTPSAPSDYYYPCGMSEQVNKILLLGHGVRGRRGVEKYSILLGQHHVCRGGYGGGTTGAGELLALWVQTQRTARMHGAVSHPICKVGEKARARAERRLPYLGKEKVVRLGREVVGS